MQNYAIEQGRTGPSLVALGPWDDKLVDVMQAQGIREVELNCAKGWKGRDLSFLKELHFLQGLSISSYSVENLTSIQSLQGLHYLDLSIRNCRVKIDFACFPHLRLCFLHCWPGAMSILECRSLEHLYLYAFKSKQSSALRQLKNLRRLTISNGPLREVTDLDSFEKLEYLALYLLTKLESLRGIGGLKKLIKLDIKGCQKIRTLDEVGKIHSLKILNISRDGKIESLKPIASLQKLENLYFTESTVIEDGDLSVLEKLSKLNRVSFANRRHYSHKREEFWQFTKPKPAITMDRV